MQRNFFSINKCSHDEQKLLKALRALNWEGSWPTQAGFLLEEIGIYSVHAFPFVRLIPAIIAIAPDFSLLGPASPFVSKDEIELLSALGHAARSKSKNITMTPLLPTDVQTLLAICGDELRLAKVNIKPRAVLNSFKELVAHATEQYSPKLAPILVKVVSVNQITPSFQRIVFAGEALATFQLQYPAQWIKVFLPNSDMQGRAYTIRHFDENQKQLTLDIATHHQGLISSWAKQAKVGDELYITPPRGGFKDLDKDGWLLLLADETGIPSMATILEQLPAHLKVYVFIEISSEAEKQQLTTQADATIKWLFKNTHKDSLKTVLKASSLPTTQGYAWIAAEASVIRGVRTQLLKEQGFSLANIQTTGYWKLGEKDHKDLAAIL